jgi:NADPH-dependent 7-cyano-7-deazaguanine reductase QueF
MFLGIILGMRQHKLYNTSMQHKQQNKTKQNNFDNSFLYFNEPVSPLLTVWCHMSRRPDCGRKH